MSKETRTERSKKLNAHVQAAILVAAVEDLTKTLTLFHGHLDPIYIKRLKGAISLLDGKINPSPRGG